MDILKELGAQIRAVRKEMGYTQSFVGLLLSMDKSQISKIENGKYKNLEKIGYLLDTLQMGLCVHRRIEETSDVMPGGGPLPPLDISETIFHDYVPGERKIADNLLWDMDLESFNAQEGSKLIAERTIERGKIEDFYAAFDVMNGFNQFRSVLTSVGRLNPLLVNFTSKTFNIPSGYFI